TGIPWNSDGSYTAKAGGVTALIFAAQHGDLETAKMLLDAGADVNQASADGTTPLLAALYHWRSSAERKTALRFFADYKMANLLMDHGAKAVAAAGAGYTPSRGALIRMAPAPDANRPDAQATII